MLPNKTPTTSPKNTRSIKSPSKIPTPFTKGFKSPIKIDRLSQKSTPSIKAVKSPIKIDRLSQKSTPSTKAVKPPIKTDRLSKTPTPSVKTTKAVKSPIKTDRFGISRLDLGPQDLLAPMDIITPPRSGPRYIAPISRPQSERHISTKKPIKIGSGTYGCVYHPPLECRDSPDLDKKNKDAVMKVMDPSDSSLELKISDKVRSIDPYQKYFLPLTGESCKLSDIKQLETTRCQSYIDSVHKNAFRGYFIPYGGHTLDYYIIKPPFPTIITIWRWVIHLVYGLHHLHRAGLVHLDIKATNIVLHNQLPKLIDFGLARDIRKFTYRDMVGPYSLYPLFYNYLLVSDREQLYNIYEDDIIAIDPNYVRDSENDPIYNFLEAYGEMPLSQFMKRVIIPNLEKVDIFMLFMMVQNNFINLLSSTFNRENKYLIDQLSFLTDACLQYNVNQQLDTHGVINFIEKNILHRL
jgi:hypothetical protein